MTVVKKQKEPLTTMAGIMECLDVEEVNVHGDGNCLFHAIIHQLKQHSTKPKYVLGVKDLRYVVSRGMSRFPGVRKEDGMNKKQWAWAKKNVKKLGEWGSDMELRIMAIQLKVPIFVINKGGFYTKDVRVRLFPRTPPPMENLDGGIYRSFTPQEMCALLRRYPKNEWPLIVIFNGVDHFYSVNLY